MVVKTEEKKTEKDLMRVRKEDWVTPVKQPNEPRSVKGSASPEEL